MNLPEWTLRMVIWAGIIGFPFVVLISWLFQLTPEGLVRDEGEGTTGEHTHALRLLNLATIVLLSLALILVVLDSYILDSGGQATDGGRDSIAVLPFANMSGDASQEYFSDGLSEELLNLLSRVEGLKVAARTSSFAFKGKHDDIRKVGDALGVGTVLEGSVRRSGSRVRVTAQLIDVDSGYHLWSDNFDRTMDDIFAIQDQIAAAIVEALQVHLGSGGAVQVVEARPTHIEAYDLYLKGLEESRIGGTAGNREALELFRAATEIDPDFAAAWAARARMVVLLRETAFWGDIPQAEAIVLARQAIERALAINPAEAEAYVAEAMLHADLYRYREAFESLEKALAINPNNTEALSLLAILQVRVGSIRAGRENTIKALALDPLHPRILNVAGEILSFYSSGDNDIERLVTMAPEALQRVRDRHRLLRGPMSAELMRATLEDPPPDHELFEGDLRLTWLKEYDPELLSRRSRHPGEYAFWSSIHGGQWEAAQDLLEGFPPDRREAVINLEELSIMQAALGECEASLATLERAHGGEVPVYGMIAPGFPRANSNLAANRVYCLQQLGRNAEAGVILERVLHYLDTLRENADCCYAVLEAKVRVLKGDSPGAVAVLDAGFKRGEIDWMFRHDPVLRTLEADPGFQALVNRIDDMIDKLRAGMGMPPADL